MSLEIVKERRKVSAGKAAQAAIDREIKRAAELLRERLAEKEAETAKRKATNDE